MEKKNYRSVLLTWLALGINCCLVADINRFRIFCKLWWGSCFGGANKQRFFRVLPHRVSPSRTGFIWSNWGSPQPGNHVLDLQATAFPQTNHETVDMCRPQHCILHGSSWVLVQHRSQKPWKKSHRNHGSAQPLCDWINAMFLHIIRLSTKIQRMKQRLSNLVPQKSMDWLLGKSTGNHSVFHQIHHPITPKKHNSRNQECGPFSSSQSPKVQKHHPSGFIYSNMFEIPQWYIVTFPSKIWLEETNLMVPPNITMFTISNVCPCCILINCLVL